MTYQFVPQKAKQSINDKKHYQVSRGHFVVKTMCLTWMDEFGWVEVLWRPLECQLSEAQCTTKVLESCVYIERQKERAEV